MKTFYTIITALVAFLAVCILGSAFLVSIDPQYVWYLARASGITAYLMLFLLTMTGMGLTSGFIYNLFGPVFSWRLHRTYGITLVAAILIHLITLLYDTTVKFSLADIFIPFYAQFQPLYLSLGIIGFYLIIIVILTSITLIVKKYKAWRWIHYLSFPAYIMLFLHGVLIGTDSNNPLMTFTYWATGILFLAALVYRLGVHTKNSSQTA